jgi:TRAP-type C4-dicarboxylate transport system permease small subunit
MADDTRPVALTARLAASHDALSRLGFDVAAGCLGIIVCSYCYEVVSRYFFNAPTIWAGPLVSYMLCALVFLAAPDITRKNTHIVINVVQEKMSPKHVAYLQKFVTAVSAGACLMGVWIVGATVISQYTQGIETILTWAIPKWPLSAMIAYGLLSSGIHFLRHLASGEGTQESTAAVS